MLFLPSATRLVAEVLGEAEHWMSGMDLQKSRSQGPFHSENHISFLFQFCFLIGERFPASNFFPVHIYSYKAWSSHIGSVLTKYLGDAVTRCLVPVLFVFIDDVSWTESTQRSTVPTSIHLEALQLKPSWACPVWQRRTVRSKHAHQPFPVWIKVTRRGRKG